MNNKIIHGNCLDVFKKLKDESFDHCITDPPYNTFGFLDLKLFFKIFLIKVMLFLSSSFLGIIPVPIDQTGS